MSSKAETDSGGTAVQLSDKEMKVLAHAWACVNVTKPRVDYEKLALLTGYSNPHSVRNLLSALFKGKIATLNQKTKDEIKAQTPDSSSEAEAEPSTNEATTSDSDGVIASEVRRAPAAATGQAHRGVRKRGIARPVPKPRRGQATRRRMAMLRPATLTRQPAEDDAEEEEA
ncbi:hypothetical protein GGR50DRAFT_706898 [Xylaria sp. CBS 124048]|nr:hypothetical protein GGR50DRAFT_706898 [Xylaria sp. CBS 124048]